MDKDIEKALMDALVDASRKVEAMTEQDEEHTDIAHHDGIAVGLHRAIDIIKSFDSNDSPICKHGYTKEASKYAPCPECHN